MANETLSVSNKDGTEVKSNGSSEMVPPAPSEQHIPPPTNDAASPAGNFLFDLKEVIMSKYVTCI